MSKAPAVDYALEIIELFAKANKQIGIADISNTLNINKNAVSRVLDALLEKDWIYLSDKCQKKYSLTLRPFTMISQHINNRSIVNIAAPFVEELNEKLGDAVYLGVKNQRNVLYLMHCDSSKEVRINGRAGGEYPLNCSAPGKVLLSYCCESERKEYFNTPVDKRTKNTITDYTSFALEAEKIKKACYAIDNEEFADGIVCIAVPVYDCDANVVATLGISSLTIYDSVHTLIVEKLPELSAYAKKISACLGYTEK